MAVFVSMLRGVNVGGHNRIKMESLRKLYESIGLQHPQTFIQSGNVVFRTGERDSAALGRKIEQEIEQGFGFRPAIILRTLTQLRKVVAENPFATRSDVAPDKLLVTFLANDLGRDAHNKLSALQIQPEEIQATASELYVYYPEGMGRSKLPVRIDKILGTPGTSRNWNSVLKLLAMAESQEVDR